MVVRIHVDVGGLSVLLRNKDRYKGALRLGLIKALNEAGLVVQNEARRLILQGPKTGRWYKRGKNRNIRHRASAPGESPASDTGTLVRNIVMHVNETTLTAEVIANTRYAGFLENGTSRMVMRPFLSKALANRQDQILKIFTARLKSQ